jgi:DNA polymerase-3 subunit gamma/tau
VGKTTLARVLAKSVNCTDRAKGKFEPCGKCKSCEEITAGRSLDIIEIDAASHTGVDNVRENIIASARVTPSRLKYKVFIIDEVHMLSLSSFNALLKTIEEPPAYVIFILCTTEVHKVPTTIISRCQRFDFKRISTADVVKKLNHIVNAENIKINKEIPEAIARFSGGHMRDAESTLGQIVNIGGKEITREEADLVIPRSDLGEAINLIELLSKKDAAGGIRLVNKIIDEGIDLRIFLSDLIEVLRKLLLIKINPALAQKLAVDLGETLELKLSEVGQGLSPDQVLAFIDQFVKTGAEIKTAAIPQLPFELAIARLCTGVSAPRPAAPFVQTANRSSVPGAVKSSPAPGAAKSATAPAKTETSLKGERAVSFEEILAKWNELLIKVKKYNHSLSFILRVCQPRNLRGNELCLAFKYKFHKDRVNDPQIRGLVEKVLHEVYDTHLRVDAVIDENLEIENGNGEAAVANDVPPPLADEGGADNKMIDKLLKTFGGKIVG